MAAAASGHGRLRHVGRSISDAEALGPCADGADGEHGTGGVCSGFLQLVSRQELLFTVFFLQTVEKFLQLSATALLHAPPVPPVGFWLGALLLAAGSAAYLAASNVPQSASRTKTAKIKQT